MQYKFLYAISALIGVTVAQDFSNVPKCAMAPALAAFGKTGCAITNIKCLCQSTSLVPDLESAVAKVCTPAELAQVNSFAVSTCKSVGVDLVIPSASSGIASATGVSSASGNSTASVATTTITSSSGTSTAVITSSGTTSVSTTGGSIATTASPTTSAGQSSSSTQSATPSASTGAGNVVHIGSSALAGAFLFALAL